MINNDDSEKSVYHYPKMDLLSLLEKKKILEAQINVRGKSQSRKFIYEFLCNWL